jgi:hypothetical protein
MIFNNTQELLDEQLKANAVQRFVQDCMDGLMLVLRKNEELLDIQEELSYGQVIASGQEYCKRVDMTSSNIIRVQYEYVDPFDDYDTLSVIDLPYWWVDLYLQGQHEELIKVVLEQQRDLADSQGKVALTDLERMAEGMGYKLTLIEEK